MIAVTTPTTRESRVVTHEREFGVEFSFLFTRHELTSCNGMITYGTRRIECNIFVVDHGPPLHMQSLFRAAFGLPKGFPTRESEAEAPTSACSATAHLCLSETQSCGGRCFYRIERYSIRSQKQFCNNVAWRPGSTWYSTLGRVMLASTLKVKGSRNFK